MSDLKDIVEGIGDFDVSKMLAKVPYPYNKSYLLYCIDKSIIVSIIRL